MVFAMGEAMIFVVDSDEAVGQCDDEDMRKLEALAAKKTDELADKALEHKEKETEPETDPENQGTDHIFVLSSISKELQRASKEYFRDF